MQTSKEPYDFYLVPQNTTQGCVTPTHFFVAYDTSSLTKEALETMTFALCHYYFNWAGPIKVPSPCMYAHKLAELHMFLRQGEDKLLKKMKNKKPVGIKISGEKISKLLHFL